MIQTYSWPDDSKCCLCISIDLDAEAPLLWEMRDRQISDIGELEMRRFGPRTGLFRIQTLLDELSINATFFVPALVAQMYPKVMDDLAHSQREIGLHGFCHERLSDLDERQTQQILESSIAVLSEMTGRQEFGYRSPSWEMTREMLALLRDDRILYDSSLMGFDHPYDINDVVEVPVQWMLDDAIYFKFVGSGRDKWPPVDVESVLNAWTGHLQSAARYGSLVMITLHPWIIGQAPRMEMLRAFLQFAKELSGVWIADASQIAEWHKDSNQSASYKITEPGSVDAIT